MGLLPDISEGKIVEPPKPVVASNDWQPPAKYYTKKKISWGNYKIGGGKK